jgi:hypothetical protein
MHAAAVEAASAAPETAAPSTAGFGIIGYQTYGDENERCRRSKNRAKHDATLLVDVLANEGGRVRRSRLGRLT